MAVAVASLLLVGCAPKVNADEAVRILAKGMLTLDFTDAGKLGINKEKQEKMKSETIKRAKAQVKTMMMAMGRVKISDDQAQQIVDKIYETQKKVAVSTKLISEQDKEAVVSMSIQAIDGEKMAELMQDGVTRKVQEMTPEDMQKQAGKIITETYLEIMDQVEFKDEPTVIEVKCKLDEKSNKWLPEEDAAKFGAKLGQIVWGMDLGL